MLARTALIYLAISIVSVSWLTGTAAHAEPSSAELRQTWQMLDYMAVDYPGAVQDGRIVAPGEYAEMQEFAEMVRKQLAAAPVTPNQPELRLKADQLAAAVATKAAPVQVAELARELARDVLLSYPIRSVPTAPPVPAKANATYIQHCAVCHGADGRGDGPAAAGMDPQPIDFTDAARAAQRTPFALHAVVMQGVSGTSMPSFAMLSEEEQWSLAFYVGGMAYSQQDQMDGERLWRNNKALHETIPSLEKLIHVSEESLATTIPPAQAKAVIAYLRAHPQAANESGGKASSFTLARKQLANSQRAYAAGNATQAVTLALSAYLDGVEPVEPTLAARNAELLRAIETAMAEYRAQLGSHATLTETATQAEHINVLFDRAEALLQSTHADATTAFLGSFTILVREGLEALVIVIGMIAFLRKAERREVLPYVHAGWVSALLAGGATWAAATYVINISGANREVTEGASALFAALVLLCVGIWMHQKSMAGHWQQYLHEKMSAALTRRSALFLFLLAFVAVYREVFETILFFIAMWSEEGATAIIAGLAVGITVLAGVAYWMLRVSKRLPIGKFFSVSSILIAVLAVVLVGKGVAALQEAGWISQALVRVPRIELLGVYPSWQSLLAQLAVAIAATLGFMLNRRSARASERLSTTD